MPEEDELKLDVFYRVRSLQKLYYYKFILAQELRVSASYVKD